MVGVMKIQLFKKNINYCIFFLFRYELLVVELFSSF